MKHATLTYRCAHCSRSLVGGETVTCDPCEVAQLREILRPDSPTRHYRAHVIADLETELAHLLLCARRPAWEY
jgi:hypothetical protein